MGAKVGTSLFLGWDMRFTLGDDTLSVTRVEALLMVARLWSRPFAKSAAMSAELKECAVALSDNAFKICSCRFSFSSFSAARTLINSLWSFKIGRASWL